MSILANSARGHGFIGTLVRLEPVPGGRADRGPLRKLKAPKAPSARYLVLSAFDLFPLRCGRGLGGVTRGVWACS